MMFPPHRRLLVDPELTPMLDARPAVTVNAGTLGAFRAAPRPQTGTEAAAVARDGRQVPGPDDAPDVPVMIYRPTWGAQPGPAPCILYLHGGGYVMGAPDGRDAQHRNIVATLGCVLVSVDYRLAPETPFPGAIEDCYAVLAWLFEQAETLGVDAARIGLMGESAGGGLAAALALLWRDRARPGRLAFQHLIYPMLDDRTCVTPDPHPHTGAFIWTADANRFGWSSLLGVDPGGAHVSPYAAPARAKALEGLPATFISLGALDLFLEEDLDYARRLLRAGVPTELHVYPGGFHGFDLHPSADVSIRARRDSLAALARFLRAG